MDIQFKNFVANLNSEDLNKLKMQKEETAMEFEKIFAMHMVQEMTKGSFDMVQEGGLSRSNALYREHITETLATELAKQNKLGMADLVMQYWQNKLDTGLESED